MIFSSSTCNAVACFLTLALLWLFVSSAVANPFLGGGQPRQKKDVTSVVAVEKQEQKISILSKIMTRITATQLELKQKMSGYIREYKEEGRSGPLVTLIMLAFLYGCIHAAGPGHGKGIAVAYTLGNGKSFGAGLVLGTLIAFIHAGSAMVVVFTLQWILHRNISTSLDQVTRASQLFSFGLLTVIGIVFLIASVREWFGSEPASKAEQVNSGKIFTTPFTTALAIGVVPCPGVIMILLFCLSLDQLVLGVGLGFAVSIGMALTITLAVWLTIAGKKAVFSATAGWGSVLGFLEKFLHTASALLLTVFGGLLFLSAF